MKRFGSALCRAVAQARSCAVLGGESTRVAAPLAMRLPMLEAAFAELGCQVRQYEGGEMALRLQNADIRLPLGEANEASALSSDAWSLASVASVRWILRRQVCDYAIWDSLLSRQSTTSLAGKQLVLDRYDDVGRVIAHRARGLGMVVRIEDIVPSRKLDALYDGFEIGEATDDPTSSEPFRVCVAELATRPWEHRLLGVEDELAAAIVIAAAVASRHAELATPDPKRWADRCDELVCATLLYARDGRAGPNGPADVWEPSQW